MQLYAGVWSGHLPDYCANSVEGAAARCILQVFRSTEPQVGGPDFDAELAPQEYRRHGSPTAQVEHPHPRAQVYNTGKPLGQPQGVGAPTATGNYPCRVVFIRTREPITEQPSIHHRPRYSYGRSWVKPDWHQLRPRTNHHPALTCVSRPATPLTRRAGPRRRDNKYT